LNYSIWAIFFGFVGGGADAVVFDAPVLQKHIKLTRKHQRDPVDGTITRENYGIALPIGSALRKKTNETLLDITADGTYDELYSKYFEDVHSG
jgi:ABC-type amino acid transport substrate-binding protein